jgi:glutaredoxin 3
MYILYSKDNCSQCKSAEVLLSMKGLAYNVLKLDVDFSREEFISKFKNAKSFPMILKDGEYLGTFQDLQNELKNI